MDDTKPIACTLTASDLRDREKAWLKVGSYATGGREVPGGLAFTFDAAPGVYHSLRELIRLEGECCPWMTFGLEQGARSVDLTVTGAGEDGERGVRAAFGIFTLWDSIEAVKAFAGEDYEKAVFYGRSVPDRA